MRILITGGAGFIGSHLVEHLLAAGHAVRVLDDFSTGRRDRLAAVQGHPALEVRQGDIRAAPVVEEALRGTEGVVHLAALVSVPRSLEEPALSFAVNAQGTLNVLEGARRTGCRRFVYASSAAVYGDQDALPLAESVEPAPLSPYALDKWYGEQSARLYHRLHGLETVVLRFFNVYGPRQDPTSPYSGVISRFSDSLLRGEAPLVFGDGEQTRDFICVDDVIRACAAALTGPAGPHAVFNVARGSRTSLLELLEHLRRITGSRVPARHAPPRQGDIRHSQADITAIREALGFVPQVPLAEGLTRLVAAERERAASPAGASRE
jgi:UDP-glucose 4-epimerase